MAERYITVTRDCCSTIRLESRSGNVIHLPDDELDQIMEDIKNLR